MPTTTVNGGQLHYRMDGPDEGEVLLLSNCLATDTRMWEPTVPALTSCGIRVLRYDMRGHGESSMPPGPNSIERLAADAIGLLDVLGVESAHFCGLSIGGMVGQVLGARHGHRLRSLTICNSSAYFPNKEEWDQRLAAARKVGMTALAEGMISRWLADSEGEQAATAVQSLREMIGSTPVEAFCSCAAAVRDMDLRPLLNQVRVPTHVIVGKEDQLTPVADSRFLHQQITDSTLTLLDYASHLSNLDCSDSFNASLLAHVERHRIKA